MHWQVDALKKIEKAPFFVRPLIRSKVEEFVKRAGNDVVTAVDVEEVKSLFKGANSNNPTVKQTEMIEKEVRRIEELTTAEGTIESRYYSVRMCGGAMGCPMTLINVRRTAQEIASRIEKSGLPKIIESRLKGPLLTHHKFRVAVAGCPNCCSEPQIKDFGVSGESKPITTENECIACLQCVKACRENAVFVEQKKVTFDYETCVNCGQCSRACPTQTIVPESVAYRVMAGGKLGRHPQLAQIVAELVDENTVYDILDAQLQMIIEHGKPGERLGSLLNRLGIDYAKGKSELMFVSEELSE